jgi:nickel-dependent lactate racemase
MLLFGRGSPTDNLKRDDLKAGLSAALDRLGPRRRVVAVPPDITRVHSQSGLLTKLVHEYYGEGLADILPATGTHFPMTAAEIESMFLGVPRGLFRAHDWRNGLSPLGDVPADYVAHVSGGVVDYPIPIRIDTLLVRGKHDLILSIGQVVPHEVIGMAGYNKNVFIGAGGGEGIHKTHFLGAAYGMERIMGRADTPVRDVLNYASDHFAGEMPIVYLLTVVGMDGRDGGLVVRGLFIGDDIECFHRAAGLSLAVNFEMLEKPLNKVVVYLDPSEYKSTWLGNKSIYRTRMAIADEGELVVLAPGVSQFGEDPGIDKLIREYGYVGTPRVLQLVKRNKDLQQSLGTAAHLIHGSSEGRFTITYCPGKISKEEIERAGFQYAEPRRMMQRYDPAKLRDGFNTMPDGEEVFYISNPGLGLWAYRGRMD